MYNICVSLNWLALKFGIKRVDDRRQIELLFRTSTFPKSETLALSKAASRSGYAPIRAQSVSFFTFLRLILILMNFSWLMFYAVHYVKFWCSCRFRCHSNYWLSCTWTVAHFHIVVLPDWHIPKKEDKKRKMDLVRSLFRMIG